jgi:hypothetical protein
MRLAKETLKAHPQEEEEDPNSRFSALLYIRIYIRICPKAKPRR